MKRSSFYIPEPFNMYCEKITPDIVKFDKPIVMITGVAHTSSCYLTKPDETQGWAYFFAEKGFEVIVSDWPGIGRSGHIPLNKINGMFVVEAYKELITIIGKEIILLTHSMSGPYGWKLGEIIGDKISHIIAIAPGEMGNIQAKPHIVERKKEYIKIKMGWGILKIKLNEFLKNDDEFVLKKLIGESRLFPKDNLAQYKSSLQLRHPTLTFERLNIDNSQLTINNLSRFKKIKILVVTGTHDNDHSKNKDRQIVEFFNRNNIICKFMWLEDYGLVGNGHMMMLEKNSDLIAHLIYTHLKEYF